MKLRRIEIARGAWGLALLAAPRVVLGRIPGATTDPTALAVARILGARQMGQAALSGLDPSPEVLAMGVWVDLAHAATAVGLGAGDRHRARAGLTDAAFAATWAGFGYVDLTRGRATLPAHDRRRDMLARVVLGLMPGGGPLLACARRARTTPAQGRGEELK